ncbi:MAG: phosphoribosylanthranilate isomerase [Deltaproteobacteria bacterium]|nr:phosphoribosylanthranilate isomerase [Deltaproteobacteria bacterium]
MVKVKICGITKLEDALAAAECGAHALGFVFFRKSPRYIEPDKALEIINQLPPFITPVGLFVNEAESRVWDILNTTGINVVQFHGDEAPPYTESFQVRVIKAIRVKSEESLSAAAAYSCSSILLDAWSPQAYGGTGKKFDWDILRRIGINKRVILAGGLNPDNVAYAIKLVKPYGVDVSSGVEISPGIKDHEKIKCFIERVQEAAETVNDQG